jgi:hypothetical protein
MRHKTGFFLLFLNLLVSFSAPAVEYSDGQLRLVLHGETGRFSLYSLERTSAGSRALFADQDPRTSFLSVMVNDRSYRMGDSSAFRTRLDPLRPSLIFESSFLLVNVDFAFEKRNNSAETNCVSIKINLENRGGSQISAGARFLLDTQLGEGTSPAGFTTNLRNINSETLITGKDSDSFWTDKSDTLFLTGSLNTGSSAGPDSVHFANWKKLNDAAWKAEFQQGRNFNFPPYSTGDTAVCYYFEPRPLSPGEKRSFGFTLGIDNTAQAIASGREMFRDLAPVGAPVEGFNSREQDLETIKELMTRIDALIVSGTAGEDELSAIEYALNRIRAKYISVNLR